MRAGKGLAVVVTVAALLAAMGAEAQEQPGPPAAVPEQEGPTLPAGLDTFLEACLLEASGQYREALAAYKRAMEEAGEVTEIRVRYAALLQEVGLVDTAVSVLGTAPDLDWYGLRTRGLALAQLSTQRPELLSDAEKALRAALDERSDDPNLELSLAHVVQRQGRLEEAEAIVAAVSATRPGNDQLVAYHANILRALGRLGEAAALYRQCADTATCRQGLVETLVALDRPAEAGAVLLEASGDDDLDQLLQAASLLAQGGKQAEALAAVQRVLRAQPDSKRARTLEAIVLSGLGRFDDAVTRLKALLREDRDDLDLMLSLAWNQARGGQLDDARQMLSQAWSLVESDPSSERAVGVAVAAARIELVSGRPLVAREWLGRVADPSGVGPDYVRLLGVTFRQTQEWASGVAAMLRLEPRLKGTTRSEAVALEAEMRLRQGDSKGLDLLEPLLESSDVTDVTAALAVLQATERWADVQREAAAALGRHPGDRDLRFAEAAALERLGRIEDAEREFGELIRNNPDDAAAANYLGYMWADRGVKLDRALELIKRAVELEPGSAAYLDSLGWVQFRLGNLEAAEEWLRRSVAVGERDGTVLSHLGEVLLAKGTKEEAHQLLRQALDLGCERPDRVRELLGQSGD